MKSFRITMNMKHLPVCIYLFFLSHKFAEAEVKLKWLVSCGDDDDCSDFKNATCSNGFCMCGDYSLNVCEEVSYVLANKIGGKCEQAKNCNLNNSKCGPEKKCICEEGFVSSSDLRKCLKVSNIVGGPCEEDVQCTTKITSSICLNNTCACRNNTHEHKGLCTKNSALGEECQQDEDCSATAFSSCIDSKCSCIATHVAINLKCLQIAHDLDDGCYEDTQCTTTFGDGSHCSEGICQCRDLYQFKAMNNTCVRDILLNEFCATHHDCHQPGRGPSRLMCILGVCKCRPKYREEDGYCTEVVESKPSSTAALKPSVFILYNIFVLCLISGIY